jgi:hypothetical protein
VSVRSGIFKISLAADVVSDALNSNEVSIAFCCLDGF